MPYTRTYVRIGPSGHVPNTLCEMCEKDHNGSYGRFCSIKCSRTVGGRARKKFRLPTTSADTKEDPGAKNSHRAVTSSYTKKKMRVS